MKNPATITFKAKPETRPDGRVLIKLPKFTRNHCNMNEFRIHSKYGSYANSDLFPAILARIQRETFGDSQYVNLNSLPDNVSADMSSFLTVVTINLP